MAPKSQDADERRPFPDRVGRYPLLAPIGKGGMATVYLARSSGIGGFERRVAIKLIHPHLRDEGDLASQLLQEAKLAAMIRHPNVVPVLDVGDDPFGIFLVMDYVEGETVAGLVKAARAERTHVPISISIRILSDALAGLHEAHELCDAEGAPMGLVHRDFSPQNILVGLDGTARLTDFGVAKITRDPAHTRTGLVKGKVGYMAPEQARGKRVDRRCDVWAAGVVAWEMLAGKRLFKAGDDVGALLQIVNDEIRPIGSVRLDVPRGVEAAIAWALTRDLEQRCPTAGDLRRAIVSAWREAGGELAEASEVGDYVTAVAMPRLQQRRQQIEAFERLREEMNALSEEATGAGLLSPVEPAHALGSSNSDEISLGSADILLSTTVAEGSPPSVTTHYTRPFVPASTATLPLAKAADVTTQPAMVAASTTGPRGAIQPSETKRLALAGGALAGLVLGAVLLAIAIRTPRSPPALDADTTEASSARVDPSTSESASPSAVTTSPSPPETAAVNELLTIRANAPISELRIGERDVPIETPAEQIAVDLPRQGSSLVIEAASVDGRRTTLLAPSGARSVELVFRSPARARPPRVGPNAGKTPSAPASSVLPLSPSPYGKDNP